MVVRYARQPLNSELAQNTLEKYTYDLPMFRSIMDKGMNKTDRMVYLYSDKKNEFVGYLIYVENRVKFNSVKEMNEESISSAYNMMHINDVEVRDSIRMDQSKPRYGKQIMEEFISGIKRAMLDGITLQAVNDELIEYYKRYGFEVCQADGNYMVLWLKND